MPKTTNRLTTELAAEICHRVTLGHTLHDIQTNKIASSASISRWLNRTGKLYDDFRRRYARARQGSAEAIYEAIQAIERRALLPRWIPVLDDDGNQVLDDKGKPTTELNPKYVDPSTARVVIDSMKWRASKMNPKQYGERREIEHKGRIEHQPVSADAPDWLQKAIEDSPNVVTIEGNSREVADSG
jgi:hypothetical protein